jgi:homoserine O-acetyltransferase
MIPANRRMMSAGHDLFDLGDLPLQSGEVLRDAKLAYKTHGTLNAERTNIVVFPTAYGGTHLDNEWMIAPGKALDPARWFVVCPNLFGGGLSSSPSNTPGEQGRGAFPHVGVYDNVAAQYRLIHERFNVRKIALVTGFSMGAQQAFHWGCAHPELVERIAPFCGSARTAEHNIVFLDSIKAVLTADPAWKDGWYNEPPIAGLRAVGSVWAAWGRSQTFYRQERWRDLGITSRDAFVHERYVESFAEGDANDLLAMLWTWRHADISANERFNRDFERALRSITARALVMPSETDLYFPPEDSEIEVASMPNAQLVRIPSIFGHGAGGNSNPEDSAFIDAEVARLLAKPAL